MGLSLTVLGADGGFAGARGACSGYLVRSSDAAVWLECGPGTFANLQRHVALPDLDAIVCTHEHADHWIELAVVRTAARHAFGLAALPLHATAGTLELLGRLTSSLSPPFAVDVIDEASHLEIGGQRWSFSRTDHPVETLAARVDADDASIVFSSDTGPAWDPVGLAGDVDLALVEASLDEADSGSVQHLTAAQAASIAAGLGAARLVLTHLQPGADREARRAAAAEVFDGPVDLAHIDAHFDVEP